MPKVPEGCKLVLFPHDDLNHAPDPVPNYNESMYFSVFDAGLRMGGWCRIGNRVNEGHAEMTQCVYLPDGRVAFMATRPRIQSNEKMDAGGLRFEIEKPFERIRVSYQGKVCLLARPREMADPSRAFRENPSVECRMDVVHTPAAPPVGGEIVNLDGSPLPRDPNKGFARAHYDQFMAGEGTLEIGGESYRLRGHGMRDKSWGPRYWQNIDWYRWVHVRFGPELALVSTVSDYGDGAGRRCSGFAVTPDGIFELEGGEVDSDWDADLYQTNLRLRCWTARDRSELEGRVVSLIPLRNRRQLPDGRWLQTRITEAMTEYRWNGRTALGMSEYLDQIVDGRPSGIGRG
jgi:hypothetical protein